MSKYNTTCGIEQPIGRVIPFANAVVERHPEWTIGEFENDYGDRLKVEHPSGASIIWRARKYETRVRVDGCWPMSGHRHMGPRDWGVLGYQVKEPGLTFDLTREPGKVQGSIARFAEEYMELYAKCQEKAQERINKENARDALGLHLLNDVLRGRFGDKLYDGHGYNSNNDKMIYLHDPVGGKITISQHDRVSIELTCPADAAEQILRQLTLYLDQQQTKELT